MRARAWILLCAAVLAADAARAQGYAGLGEPAEGYAQADPSYQMDFPQDHGPHPMFRVEWWYMTANLRDGSGRDFGVQWTLFRTARTPEVGAAAQGWQSPQVWMGHAALTSATDHRFSEIFARGGTGQAGTEAAPFAAWIDDWTLTDTAVTANGDGFAFELALTDTGSPVLHGQGGYSVKSTAGHASHYYSRPFLAAQGWISTPKGRVRVQGTAWFDHEWSSQSIAPDQLGWDWLALTLHDGTRLMAARVRDRANIFVFGTWIGPDGAHRNLTGSDLQITPLGDGPDPVHWRIEVPALDLDLEARAINPDARTGVFFGYWEGPVRVEGLHQGVGYLEMTGYE